MGLGKVMREKDGQKCDCVAVGYWQLGEGVGVGFWVVRGKTMVKREVRSCCVSVNGRGALYGLV